MPYIEQETGSEEQMVWGSELDELLIPLSLSFTLWSNSGRGRERKEERERKKKRVNPVFNRVGFIAWTNWQRKIFPLYSFPLCLSFTPFLSLHYLSLSEPERLEEREKEYLLNGLSSSLFLSSFSLIYSFPLSPLSLSFSFWTWRIGREGERVSLEWTLTDDSFSCHHSIPWCGTTWWWYSYPFLLSPDTEWEGKREMKEGEKEEREEKIFSSKENERKERERKWTWRVKGNEGHFTGYESLLTPSFVRFFPSLSLFPF